MQPKWRILWLLSLAELLAMTLWFSASAVVPQLEAEFSLSGTAKSWLTMSVQIGFVAGALASAIFNLADRIKPRYLIATCCALGALFNALIVLPDLSLTWIMVLRFLTGATLAGVYPPGMKIMASWFTKRRGLAIGILVAALTVGNAVPHLLNAFPVFGGVSGLPPWRIVLLVVSALALVAPISNASLAEKSPSAKASRGCRIPSEKSLIWPGWPFRFAKANNGHIG